MRTHEIRCRCGHISKMMSIEWPPKVTICTACAIPLRLVAYDPTTERTSYSRFPE